MWRPAYWSKVEPLLQSLVSRRVSPSVLYCQTMTWHHRPLHHRSPDHPLVLPTTKVRLTRSQSDTLILPVSDVCLGSQLYLPSPPPDYSSPDKDPDRGELSVPHWLDNDWRLFTIIFHQIIWSSPTLCPALGPSLKVSKMGSSFPNLLHLLHLLHLSYLHHPICSTSLQHRSF